MKALATQGKKAAKEKVEEDVSVKFGMKPGPGFQGKVQQRTKEEELAALYAKSDEAQANPDGLLIDQLRAPGEKSGVNATKTHKEMAEMLEKMKVKYPATYDLLRYQAIRMTEADRRTLLGRSIDVKALYSDPEMAAFKHWLDVLEGAGGAENSLRKEFRQSLLKERRQLASTWQEIDATIAELKSQEETVDLMLGTEEFTEEEAAAIEADPELKAAVNENPLEDPEIQLILNFMVNPRPEIDPSGVLARAITPQAVQDADILKLADAVTRKNKEIMGTKPTLSRQFAGIAALSLEEVQKLALEEPSKDKLEEHAKWVELKQQAHARIYEAEGRGEIGSPAFQQLFRSWSELHRLEEPSDLLKVRMLMDALEPRRATTLPNFNQLLKEYGPGAVEHFTEAETAADLEAAYDTDRALHDLTQGEDEIEEAEAALLTFMEDSIEDDEVMDALYPDYSETVLREFPETPNQLTSLTAADRKVMLDNFQKYIDAILEGKHDDKSYAPDSEAGPVLGSLAGLSGDKLKDKIASILNLKDVSVREASRQFLEDRLMTIARAEGIIKESVESEIQASSLKTLVQSIRTSIANDKSTDNAQNNKNLSAILDAIEIAQGVEHDTTLPVGNPLTLLNDTVHSLRVAKDVVLDFNAELNEAELRLDSIFDRAKKLTAHMMAKPENRPEGFHEIERLHREVFGSEIADPVSGISSEELMNEWAMQMKEDILMSETRSALQREQDAVNAMKARQAAKFHDAKEPIPTSLEIPDSGVYPISAADILVERPVEERIYISSDNDVDVIFSNEGVGKFLTLSEDDVKRYFPEGFSSRLAKQEFTSTGAHAILIRPQAIEAINNLKAQQATSFLGAKALSKKSSSSSQKTDVPRPMLLHGYRGCGKSAVLSQVVYWARRSGWLVVTIPDGAAALADGVYISKNSAENSWDQPKFFVKFFGQLLTAHHDKLKQIPMKSKVNIGKFSPKTLFDLVEYGSVLEAQSAQCFSIFRSEIRRVTEFPVLLAFDSYNVLYNASNAWKNPESTSYYKDPLDPSDLSLGRMFYDAHVNHKLAYGTFIGALTESEPVRRFVEDSSSAHPLEAPKYLEVTPYSVPEFTTVMEHYKHKNWVRTDMSSGSSSELYIYQLTSGFAEAIWSYTKKL